MLHLETHNLKKFFILLKKENEIANYYKKNIKEKNILFQKILKSSYSSYHLFIIQFKKIKSKNIYNKLFNDFRKKKIMVNLHYLPIHLHPIYKKLGFRKKSVQNFRKICSKKFINSNLSSIKKKKS